MQSLALYLQSVGYRGPGLLLPANPLNQRKSLRPTLSEAISKQWPTEIPIGNSACGISAVYVIDF